MLGLRPFQFCFVFLLPKLKSFILLRSYLFSASMSFLLQLLKAPIRYLLVISPMKNQFFICHPIIKKKKCKGICASNVMGLKRTAKASLFCMMQLIQFGTIWPCFSCVKCSFFFLCICVKVNLYFYYFSFY